MYAQDLTLSTYNIHECPLGLVLYSRYDGSLDGSTIRVHLLKAMEIAIEMPMLQTVKGNGNKMIRKGVRLDEPKIIMNSVFPLGVDENNIIKFMRIMFRADLCEDLTTIYGVYEREF